MEVRPGYSLTDLGMLPSEWQVDELGSLDPFVTSGSRGWATYCADSGAPFIRITNLSRDSIYIDLTHLKLVDLPPDDREGIRTRLDAGDLLFSITADIGIVGYVDSRIPRPAYINQHIALVRFDRSKIDTQFLAYFLAGANAQRVFRASTDQGAKAGMNLAGVRKIRAAFPPLPEQCAIAKALGDVDALLGGLERLITKKRDLKQAAMQQLLTGQTRLPGFGGQWEVRQLRDICRMKSGEGITSADIDEYSPFPCYGGNGLRGYTKRFTHDGDYALIGRQGALCGNVVLAAGSFFASEHAVVVTANRQTDIHWLYRVLIRMNLNQYTESTAQPGLSVAKLLLLECPAPSYEEQTAIGAVLSDMDAELAALEARRDKTRALKQAMMQELLTGRTRLI
ncbi:MAG: restriction endonuclease subunit S [Acidobacteriota bacterium]